MKADFVKNAIYVLILALLMRLIMEAIIKTSALITITLTGKNFRTILVYGVTDVLSHVQSEKIINNLFLPVILSCC